MAFEIGTAADYKDLLLRLKNFLSRANTIGTPVPGENTGNGTVETMSAENAAPTETWTLTATSGGSGATFTVSGSVSGAQAPATSGGPYDNGIVAFTITDGPVDYIVGDSFTFTVTMVMGEEVYTVLEWNTNWDGAGNYQMNVMGPGSGSEEIYTGIVTKHNAGEDWFNWYLNGYTGYVPGATFYQHPGSKHATNYLYMPSMLLWNTNIKYWFVANGRRYIVVTNVSTIYQTIYMGLVLPYGLPTQWPYPLVIAGANFNVNTGAANQRYSGTGNGFRGFPNPSYEDSAKSAGWFMDSTWYGFGNWMNEFNTISSGANVWPYVAGPALGVDPDKANVVLSNLHVNIDGTYPLFPCILFSTVPSYNIYGEFQGIHATSGHGVSSEDTISQGGKTYLVVQNTRFVTLQDFHAICLE